MRTKIFVIILLGFVVVFWHCGEKKETPEPKVEEAAVQTPKPEIKGKAVQEPKEEYVEIIEFPANLRISASDTKNILAKIPVGTKLKILNKQTWQSPAGRNFNVIWYQVDYKDKTGWISEHACKKVD